EAEAGRDLVLEPLDIGARELEDRAARLADEVVVVLPLPVPLEARLSVERELAREPGGLEELERAVDGGPPDVRALALHDLQQVVDREVALGLQERVEDHLALLAALEVVLVEVGG